ncbi:MFS transporter [Teichococcus cervicalis]|uniref:Transporter, major facilitator family protein n=1 Tax=Pseudoroseomonas cervicalis ATCC 49957 TaxID=525371 RepID=D5RQE5_9PROT|nr:MFS transporter [Pseudoroseomonas cervicalis]EFH10471.1 transporter, major facilitator family protein [Pseudoroseomonas cervicalis ATCC 49957]
MPAPLAAPAGRRFSPMMILIVCAVLTAALAMGLRQSFGLFLAPMTNFHGWSASGFAFAIALQVLINGVSQPICGQIADRLGGRVVLMGGAALYAAGTLGMALADGLPVFTFFAGLVMGVAVSAAGMPVIMASMTRLLPEDQRGRATGLGTAGSSFGQFLVVPLAGFGIAGFGWQGALFAMAAAALLMIPLSLPLNDRPAPARAHAAQIAAEEGAMQTLKRAFASRSFWCLFFGFFVCGLHVSFLSVHLPGFVASCHLPSFVGAGAISLIGLFNVLGSLLSGELTQKWRRRELLVGIYASRAVLMLVFFLAPKTTGTVLAFSAVMGILWLSTVPPTVALCARNFGTRWLATVFGLVFLGHQIGGFTGAWLGGVVFDRTGSYDLMWIIGILAAVFAALVHLPVRDQRVVPAVA